jgi:hypothetical protein
MENWISFQGHCNISGLILMYNIISGVEGGFDTKDPEYEETYSIVILPDFITLPFPSVELPEKVRW